MTRQNHIQGEAAHSDLLRAFMTSILGYKEIHKTYISHLGTEGALGFLQPETSTAVFDMRPPNVVLTPEGLVLPIDPICCALSPAALEALLKHVVR